MKKAPEAHWLARRSTRQLATMMLTFLAVELTTLALVIWWRF